MIGNWWRVMKMTCEHCKDKEINIVDNTGANIINYHSINYCADAGCAVPTIFCTCECHGINVDNACGAQ